MNFAGEKWEKVSMAVRVSRKHRTKTMRCVCGGGGRNKNSNLLDIDENCFMRLNENQSKINHPSVFMRHFHRLFPNLTKAGLIFNWIFYWISYQRKWKLARWERRIEIDEKLLGWTASSCLKIQKAKTCFLVCLVTSEGSNEWNKGSNEFHVSVKCFLAFVKTHAGELT